MLLCQQDHHRDWEPEEVYGNVIYNTELLQIPDDYYPLLHDHWLLFLVCGSQVQGWLMAV